ncbi:MAG: PAS domain-containing protein, partial [Verrucomicrobia bacterium]|nr:PAS domain-containing protein [Verrucomicrobiota bacterium]
MNDKIIRRIVALFLVIATVLVFMAIVAVRNISRAVAASDWVNHTHAIILGLGEVRGGFHASDAALRILALSGNDSDEAAVRSSLANLEEQMEIVKALTRGDAGQRASTDRLVALVAARATLTTEVLGARKSGQSDKVRALLSADIAAGNVAEVGRIVDKAKMEQMALLASRDTEAYVQAQTTRWTVWTGVGMNFALILVAGWLVRDDIAARRRAAKVLEDANAELETRVKARTAELAASNERLAAENLERRWSAQALEHQLRYNELIINSITDLVFVLTKARNISRLNPAVGHTTGWDANQLVNHPLSEFVRVTESKTGPGSDSVDPVARHLKEGRDLRDVAA